MRQTVLKFVYRVNTLKLAAHEWHQNRQDRYNVLQNAVVAEFKKYKAELEASEEEADVALNEKLACMSWERMHWVLRQYLRRCQQRRIFLSMAWRLVLPRTTEK